MIFTKLSGLNLIQLLHHGLTKDVQLCNCTYQLTHSCAYRIRPNYRPCPHNRPSPTFYFIFTYYRPLDNLFPDFLL